MEDWGSAMFLSEGEAEARLDELRRQRDALERLIADHVLYLELGRRLPGAGSRGAEPFADEAVRDRSPASARAAAMPPAPAAADLVTARRQGRALIEAAAAILSEARRPLHAAQILEGLTAKGFGLPGVDPVAALNTRLWKRAGPDGPFRRMGDAVYALRGAEEEPA
jgi:hypothetical protein